MRPDLRGGTELVKASCNQPFPPLRSFIMGNNIFYVIGVVVVVAAVAAWLL